jgi:hypothetical protein
MFPRLLFISLGAIALAGCTGCSSDSVRDPLAPAAPAPNRSTDAGPAAASKTMTVHGTLDASETGTFLPEIIVDRLFGTGEASHLGRYTVLFDPLTVYIRRGTSVGRMTLTAADGDVLTGTEAGKGRPVGPLLAHIEETVTITGGTGRFAGATGRLTFVRLLDQATGISHGTVGGTIVLAH